MLVLFWTGPSFFLLLHYLGQLYYLAWAYYLGLLYYLGQVYYFGCAHYFGCVYFLGQVYYLWWTHYLGWGHYLEQVYYLGCVSYLKWVDNPGQMDYFGMVYCLRHIISDVRIVNRPPSGSFPSIFLVPCLWPVTSFLMFRNVKKINNFNEIFWWKTRKTLKENKKQQPLIKENKDNACKLMGKTKWKCNLIWGMRSKKKKKMSQKWKRKVGKG